MFTSGMSADMASEIDGGRISAGASREVLSME
jgi:hypothetical protein